MNNGHRDKSQLASVVKIEKIDTEDELENKFYKDDYSKSISPESIEIDLSNIEDENTHIHSTEYKSPESEMCVLKNHVDRCMKVECDEVIITPLASRTYSSQTTRMNNGHRDKSQLASVVKIEKNDTEDELDNKFNSDNNSKSISPESIEIDLSNIKDEHNMEYTSPESDMCVLKNYVDRCMKVECDEVIITPPASRTYNSQTSDHESKNMKLATLEENRNGTGLRKFDTGVRLQENVSNVKKLSIDKAITEITANADMVVSCRKKLGRKRNQKNISNKQTGVKPFQCNICTKYYYRKGDLTVHFRLHTGDKQFKCHLCDKHFYKKSDFAKHSRTHIVEKPFKCEVCEKRFYLKGTLKSHISSHTGEKPFKCDVCKKSFNRKNTLNAHIRIHTGTKPFKCDVCEKGFYLKGNLNTHIRIHTGEKPFKCDVCEKSFSQEVNLNRHILIHTGEKPFKCDVCKKYFSQKFHLNSHIRIHTGEKPYKCHVCEKSFRHRITLKGHIRRIHTGKNRVIATYVNRALTKKSI